GALAAQCLAVTEGFGFCVGGVGTTCLPDEKQALDYINSKLSTEPQPLFPIVNAFYIRTSTVQSCIRNTTLGTISSADLPRAADRIWTLVQDMARDLQGSTSCHTESH